MKFFVFSFVFFRRFKYLCLSVFIRGSCFCVNGYKKRFHGFFMIKKNLCNPPKICVICGPLLPICLLFYYCVELAYCVAQATADAFFL